MDVLQRITDLRNKRGWSKNHLAKMSGVSQSTVSNLYNRSNEPTISTVENLCKGFGIPLVQFFNIDNEAIFLTTEQKKLLSEWARLSVDQKTSILNLISHM